MSKVYINCPNCQKLVEAEFIDNKWYCTNCNYEVTDIINKQVVRKTKSRK